MVPTQLRSLHSVLKIAEGPYQLPAAAVKFGCWMDKKSIENVALANGATVPAGSGKMSKKGERNKMKRDWAWALVEKFWSGEPQEAKQKMVDGMCWGSKHSIKAPLEIIQSVQMLDFDNAETFRDLANLAQKAYEQSEKAQGRGHSTCLDVPVPQTNMPAICGLQPRGTNLEAASRRKHFTPAELPLAT